MSTDVDERNRETSRAELTEFLRDLPARYFAYYATRDRGDLARYDVITTWVGDELARITWVGDAWTSNMGDRRQSFRAVTTNGRATYAGTAYLSSGDYVRMRRVAG